MESTSAITAIRKNAKLLLDANLPLLNSIALSLIYTAMFEGVNKFHLIVGNGGEIIAGFDKYWIQEASGPEKYKFDRLSPIKGLQNTFRGEALLAAFTDYAIIKDGNILFSTDEDLFNCLSSIKNYDCYFYIVFKEKRELEF